MPNCLKTYSFYLLLIAILFGGFGYGQTHVTDNLILYYDLNSTFTSGSTSVNDLSTTNNDGTLQGTVFGSGLLDFDGVDDFISTSNSFSSLGPQEFSLEIWFKTTSANSRLIGYGNNQTASETQYDRHLYINDEGKVVFGVYAGSVKTVKTTGSETYIDGEWHQALATYSKTNKTGKLYIDGSYMGSLSADYAQEYNGYWRIGGSQLSAWPNGSDNNYTSEKFFKGNIGVARIYHDVLSDMEVLQNYKASVGQIKIVDTGGDLENDTWEFNNNIITTSINAKINKTIIQNYANSNSLTISANSISVESDIEISTSSKGITLKANDDISINDDVDIKTNNGNVILWSNADGESDSVNNGYIVMKDGSTIISNGGHVWLGGGSGSRTWNGVSVGDGYALGGSNINSDDLIGTGRRTSAGLYFENATIDSDGGDIAAFGYGDDSGERGFTSVGTFKFDSGNGTTLLDTKSENSYATVFGHWHGALTTKSEIVSNNNTDSAIVISATSSGTNAIYQEGELSVVTTNNGNISVNAKATTKDYNVSWGGKLNVLSNGGDIDISLNNNGFSLADSSREINLGSYSNTITTSSSNITVISNDLTSIGSYDFSTSGTVTIKPKGSNSFSSTFNNSNLEFSTNVTSLTLGTSSNTANITISDDIEVAGPISIYGGHLAIQGNIETTALGDIKLKGYTTSANYGININDNKSVVSDNGHIDIHATGGTTYYGLYMGSSSKIEAKGSDKKLEVTAVGHSTGGGIYMHTSATLSSTSDINIYANGGTSSNGIDLNSHAQIRSTGANININAVGYRGVWGRNNSHSIRAYNDLTINALATVAHGIYSDNYNVTCSSGVSCGWVSDEGNIVINAINKSNNGYATYLRNPLITKGTTAGKGNITYSGTSTQGGILLDSDLGYIHAQGNVNLIGYGGGSSGNAIHISEDGPALTASGGGTIRSESGDVIFSAFGAHDSGVQFANNDNIRIIAKSGDIIFQGASLSTNDNSEVDAAIRTEANTAITDTYSSILNIITTTSNPRTVQPAGFPTAETNTPAKAYFWPIYLQGGQLLAVNNPYAWLENDTSPSSGGNITLNGEVLQYTGTVTSKRNTGAGIAIFDHLDMTSYGDISFEGNAAADGLNSLGANHGVIIWSTTSDIISVNGDISLTGYANGKQTNSNFETDLLGAGVYIHSDHNSLKAENNIHITGTNPTGIGVWLREGGTGKGLSSANGDINIRAINNTNNYYASYIRQKILASTGSVTISAAGNYGLTLDNIGSKITAAGNINLIGYGSVAHGLYFNGTSANFLESTNGSITLSANTESSSTYYGLRSGNSIKANQNVVFQGSELLSSSSGSGKIINALTANPITFATASNTSKIGGANEMAVYWTHDITATNGHVKIYGDSYISSDITAGSEILVEGENINLSGDFVTTENNSPISLLSKGHIWSNNAISLTTSGTTGNILLASNTNNSSDGGTLRISHGLTANSKAGDITLGGGNLNGTGFALGEDNESYSEGVRIDKTLSLDSGNGNISIKGKTSSRNVSTAGYGNSGFGVYYLTSNAIIDSGTGSITIEGINQNASNATTYSSGILFALNSNKTVTISSESTSPKAIKLKGLATGSNAGAHGMEIDTNSPLYLEATGNGGGISINTSQNTTDVNRYDLVARSTLQVLAKSGPIEFIGGAEGAENGILYFSQHPYIGSKSGSNITSSSSNILIEHDKFSWGSINPKIATSGHVTIKPHNNSFSHTTLETDWFSFNQNSQTMSGLTIGKSVNTANITHNTNAVEVAGPISIYGGVVTVNANITSSANGDIFLKGISGANGDVVINSGKTITKSNGTGTLSLQGHGRVINNGTITTTSSGTLNVIMWSDYDNDNNDGGVTSTGSISTNGGHVWLGGSSTTNGTKIWNGLNVGDGPSIGNTGFNHNALDLYGDITTNGGDAFIWAGDGLSSSNRGITTDSNAMGLNLGSGDAIIIADEIKGSSNSMTLSTTGQLTIAPNNNAYPGTFSWDHNKNTTNLNLAGYINYFYIYDSDKLSGLTIGQYKGTGLSGDSSFDISNTSDITVTDWINIAGPISLYGGTIAINDNLTSNTSTGTITLQAGTAITQTASISTHILSLTGSGTTNLSNAGNSIDKLSAGTATITTGALSFTNSKALEIGVGADGILSSGTINIGTLSGNLTLSKTVSTTNSSADAIKLYADKNEAAGNEGQGNIIINGAPSISVGSGGRASLYSGKPSSSTGLVDLLESNSSIRTNVDSSTSSFAPSLSSGTYALFRTGPNLTFSENSLSIAHTPATLSRAYSFVLSGTLLSSVVSVTAPTGFEISQNETSGYGSQITLNHTSGSLAETTIYVRIPSSVSGYPSGTLSITAEGLNSQSIQLNANANATLDFDGSDDYVEINDLAPNLTSDFTVEMWVNFDSLDGNIYPFSIHRANKQNKFLFGFYSNNNLSFLTYGDSSSDYIKYEVDSNFQIQTNNWYHLSITRSANNFKLYINGVKALDLNRSISIESNSYVSLGQEWDGGSTSDFMNGQLEEVRFWNTARSQSEIQENMYESLSGTSHTGLISSYNFNDGVPLSNNSSNDTLYDQVGNNDGTLTNFSNLSSASATTSTWVANPFPESDIPNGYSSMPVALWKAIGTSETRSSNGLTMTAPTTLSAENYVNFASTTGTGTTTSNVSSTENIRSNRIWYVNETGNVSATVKIGVASATGQTVSSFVSPTFTLIKRDGTSGDFTRVAQGTRSGDVVTFTNVELQDGYYSLGVVQNVLLTPTASQMKFEGKSDKIIAYTTSPIVSLSGTLSRTSGETAGTYSITIGSVSSSLYSISLVNEGFTITPVPKAALDFDGSDDYVEIPYSSELNITGNLTMATWFYLPTDYSGSSVILGRFDGTSSANVAYSIRISGAGNLYSQLGNGTAHANSSLIPIENLKGKWSHIAVSFNSANNKINIYLNGIHFGETTGTNSLKSMSSSSTAKLSLGTYKGGSYNGQYFKGKIEEVSIWKKVLSQTDIEQYMYSSLDGDEIDLVAHYSFNDGVPGANNSANTTLYDNVGSNNGTLNGFSSAELSNTSPTSSNWFANPFPESDIPNGYSSMPVALWKAIGTDETRSSNGLTMTAPNNLSAENYVNFASTTGTGTTTSNVSSTENIRSNRIWYVNETGNVSATVKIGVASATGQTVSSFVSPTFTLIKRAGTSGDFSRVAVGSSSGDVVTFTNVELQDGYYSLGMVQNVLLTPTASQSKTLNATEPTLSYTTSPSVSLSGTLSRTAGETVGSYSITIGTISSSLYSITLADEDFEIVVTDPNINEWDDFSLTYGELVSVPSYTTSATSTASYTSSNTAVAEIHASSGTVTATGVGTTTLWIYFPAQGQFIAGTKSLTVTVLSKTLTITAEDKTKVYESNVYTPTDYTVTYNGFVGGDDQNDLGGTLTFTGTALTATDSGTYTIIPSGYTSDNYNMVYESGTLSITQKPITITITDISKNYGSADPSLDHSITIGSVHGQTATGSLTRTFGEEVGSYNISKNNLTYGSNYVETFINGSLSITARTIAVTAAAKTKVYGALDPELTLLLLERLPIPIITLIM